MVESVSGNTSKSIVKYVPENETKQKTHRSDNKLMEGLIGKQGKECNK